MPDPTSNDSSSQSPRTSVCVAVAGGSIGGLAAGIALRGIGADVQVYEREPGPMRSRGAGIVVQPDLLELLRGHGAPPLPMTGCSTRRYLTPDGSEPREVEARQQFTSWEAIYRTMRAAFPDARYHMDAAVTGHDSAADDVGASISGQPDVEADLMVAADGAGSATRKSVLPRVPPQYAGYIAWRGTLAEAQAPQALVSAFDERFTFCPARSGGHMLVYLIPGANADAAAGHRRLNWVWYVSPSDEQLEQWLTDRQGRRHRASLPAGQARQATVESLRARAREEVAPLMAELVEATPDPFIQSITDVEVDRTAFERVLLLGDAAFVVRPHTAAAAAKACFDAMTLAQALNDTRGDIPRALTLTEQAQLRLGRRLVQQGKALGRDWPKRKLDE